jgi:hypothetical protein
MQLGVYRDMLSWEAATRRLLRASLLPRGAEAHTKVDKALVQAHTWVSTGRRGDQLRKMAGGEDFFQTPPADVLEKVNGVNGNGAKPAEGPEAPEGQAGSAPDRPPTVSMA